MKFPGSLRRVLPAWMAGLILVVVGGCGTSVGNRGDGGLPGETDDEHYDRVAAELAAMRTELLPEAADELYAYGPNLFWLEFPGFAPTLHSWSRAGGTTDYGFSLGDPYNYRVSNDIIVTAIREGDNVRYEAYQIGQPNQQLGTTTVPAPVSSTRWHAYAADGTTAYIVEEALNETRMLQWIPGTTPTVLWTFEGLGYEIGIFQDFDVENGTIIFIESGRIWSGNVNTGVAAWLGNETQITGDINFDTTGVVWTGPYDMYYYQYASGEQVNLTEVINAASYAFNGTYDLAHGQLEMGYTRLGNKLVYESLSGLYLFDLVTRGFTPIVLEEREWEVRVTWRGPVILDDGTLFVTGLESESGSVGADGPVWMIEHPALMQ